MRRIVAIDPSGNFTEGSGTTGYIVAEVYDDLTYKITETGSISAKSYENRVDFWKAHKLLLSYYLKGVKTSMDEAIIEDYRLYNHQGAKAAMQSYSQLETVRLLGVLELFAAEESVDLTLQMANTLVAWNEFVLVNRGILEKKGNRYYLDNKPTNDHVRSALKHFMVWLAKEKRK